MRLEDCNHDQEVDFIGKDLLGFTGGKIVGKPWRGLPTECPDVWSVTVRVREQEDVCLPIFLKDLKIKVKDYEHE